jgi:hypothetical protein
MRETAEAVASAEVAHITPLKRGVNESRAVAAKNFVSHPKLAGRISLF